MAVAEVVYLPAGTASAGGGWSLVTGYPVTLGADTTEQSFSSLTGDSKVYLIQAWIKCGVGANFTLKVNGSAASFNYAYEPTAGTASVAATELWNCGVGDDLWLEELTLLGPGNLSGAKRLYGTSRVIRDGGGSMTTWSIGSYQWGGAAEVTSFAIVSSAANGIKSGSKFWLYEQART